MWPAFLHLRNVGFVLHCCLALPLYNLFDYCWWDMGSNHLSSARGCNVARLIKEGCKTVLKVIQECGSAELRCPQTSCHESWPLADVLEAVGDHLRRGKHPVKRSRPSPEAQVLHGLCSGNQPAAHASKILEATCAVMQRLPRETTCRAAPRRPREAGAASTAFSSWSSFATRRETVAHLQKNLLSEPPSLRVFPSASLAEELEHGRGTQRWPASLRPLQAQASPRFLEALNWQTTRARSAPPTPQAPKCNGEGRSHG